MPDVINYFNFGQRTLPPEKPEKRWSYSGTSTYINTSWKVAWLYDSGFLVLSSVRSRIKENLRISSIENNHIWWFLVYSFSSVNIITTLMHHNFSFNVWKLLSISDERFSGLQWFSCFYICTFSIVFLTGWLILTYWWSWSVSIHTKISIWKWAIWTEDEITRFHIQEALNHSSRPIKRSCKF